jgi:Tfp pilus assembly protein PilF
MNPSSSSAHANLGNIYMLEGQRQEAIQEYEAAVRLKPNDRKLQASLDLARGGR